MRLSRYFLPTIKESPTEATIASHRLMLRAGMVQQESAGIYSWLPMGLRVLDKIAKVIIDAHDANGCHRVLMPTIQSADLWRQSGRYEAYGKEMLRITDRHDRELLYGPTNEEQITEIFKRSVKSYKQFPQNLYQIQWKFRDEIRPRFGVMRGREFLMKDAYSFDLDLEGAKASYKNMYELYMRIFKAMGLKAIPVKADSGAIGGDMSHEFQIVALTGESKIFYDKAFDTLTGDESFEELSKLYAAAEEKHDPAQCPVDDAQLARATGIEIGHIFYFGKKYSEQMNLAITGPDGAAIYPEMGSYGIGVSRLVGAIIEANHDERGICWPLPVAPFHVGIINMRADDAELARVCDGISHNLTLAGCEVLYDDREGLSGGVKFADMDLIGVPFQVIIGPKGFAAGIAEVKDRRTDTRSEVKLDALVSHMTGLIKRP